MTFAYTVLFFSFWFLIIKRLLAADLLYREQIVSLREWANIRAVTATKKEDLTAYSTKEESSSNISEGRGGRTLEF